MFKKTLCFVLIILFIFSLTACGEKKNEDKPSNNKNIYLGIVDSTSQENTNPTQNNNTSETKGENNTETTTPTETQKPNDKNDTDSTTSTIPIDTTKPTDKNNDKIEQKPITQPSTETTETKPSEDRVIVKVEDIPVVEEEIKDVVIDTPDIEEEIKIESKHTEISATAYYQYNSLASSDKQLYNQLVEAMKNTTNKVEVKNQTISYNKGLSLIQKVIADHPQFFWVSKSVSILYNPQTNNVNAFLIFYSDGTKTDQVDNNYNLVETADRNKINSQIKALNSKVEQILKDIPIDISQIEKEKIIHDYIVRTVSYDNNAASKTYGYGDTLPHAFDLYGAVVEGKAVCEGYAKMFQYLCYCVGINSSQVVGTSSGENHMWNVVKIDNEWYQLDITWNDNNSATLPYYGYFNIPSSEMYKDHTVDMTNISVPSCNTNKYAYYKYYALYVNSLNTDATNYKFVIDNIMKEKPEYLIVSNKNIAITQTYLKDYIFHANSGIQKHITENNYNIKFELKYRVFGEFVYIPILYN